MKFYIFLFLLASHLRNTGAQVAYQFWQDGILGSASSTGVEYNAGGLLTLNGFVVTVPKNFFVEFPAKWVPWKEFAAGSFTGFEVNVFGNIVDGEPIAGMLQIAQNLLHFGTGVVDTVDIADGSLKLVGGSRLRINDPNAVFSKGSTASPYFTADDESPSVQAFSGFPMCIPRSTSDALCPSSNRPNGRRNFQAPDPLVMAPFLAGDQIEFSGIVSGNEILAYEVAAINVQITTTGTPSYIRVEDALIGVVDTSLNTEFADTRFIGYTSDASVTVLIEAIDVDPCTGDETLRTIGSIAPRAGDVRNKFEFRAEGTTPSTYTREYRLSLNNGQRVTKNNITAGEYIQPVTEWIFPEVDIPGAEPPPLAFAGMPFLTQGWFLDGKSYGQLDPFPAANVPSAKACSAPAPTGTGIPSPTANAGPDATVRPGVVVQLRGANGDNAAPNAAFATSWSQVSGPSVTLASAAAATASFTAPAQAAATPVVSRIFALTLTSLSDGSINSTDNVTIATSLSAVDAVFIDAYTWTSSQSGTISVTAHSSVVDGSQRAMTLTIDGTSARSVLMTSLGGGRWSYSSRSVKQPNTVTVSSDLGGSASTTTTTARRAVRAAEKGIVERLFEG